MHCTLTLTQFKLDYTHTLHKYKNLLDLMHIHDILYLCIICCTLAYYCVYICVHNVECVHTVYNVH